MQKPIRDHHLSDPFARTPGIPRDAPDRDIHLHVAAPRGRDAEQAILPLIPAHLAHQPAQRATLFGIGRLQCPAMPPRRRQPDLEPARRLVDGGLDGVVARQAASSPRD